MKNILRLFLVVPGLLSNVILLDAQWVKTSCPTVGNSSIAMRGTNIFLGTWNQGVYKSTDNGTTWNPVNSGLASNSVNCFTVADTTIYSGTWNNLYPEDLAGGLYFSSNDGLSWIADTVGLGDNAVTALAVCGTNIFAGTPWNPRTRQQGGVYLSTNRGASWTLVSSSWPVPDTSTFIGVSAFCFSYNATGDTTLFAATSGAGVFLSTNNGATWNGVDPSLGNIPVITFAVYNDNILAGTVYGGQRHHALYLSTNNGNNWSSVSSELPLDTSISVRALAISTNGSGGTNIFAGTDVGVYLSSDNGANWIALTSGLPSNTPIYALAIVPTTQGDTNLFAASYYGVWTHPFSKSVATIALSQYSLGFGPYQSNTLRITNSSQVPLVIDSEYTETKWFTIGSVHATINEGDTISLPVSFEPDTLHQEFSDTLYILSNSFYPITKVPLNGHRVNTAVSQIAPNVPDNYGLSQNYPNPFNPTTVISYQLAKNGFVTLRVYDMLGREVATLVNAWKNSGKYNISFNGQNLASGVYFYRLHAGTYNQTKKLTLLK